LTFSGRIMRCPLPEGDLSVARLRMLALCAVTVAQAVRNGRRVLVTSHKGTGRSALIAGVALGQLTTMGAREIIELIRARRPGALQDARLCAIIEKLVGSGRPKAKRGRILRRSD
jgi:protein-tyrosine phosphatase